MQHPKKPINCAKVYLRATIYRQPTVRNNYHSKLCRLHFILSLYKGRHVLTLIHLETEINEMRAVPIEILIDFYYSFATIVFVIEKMLQIYVKFTKVARIPKGLYYVAKFS